MAALCGGAIGVTGRPTSPRCTQPGRYFVAIDGLTPPVVTAPFLIDANVFDGQVRSNLINYLNSVRSTGVFDRADRSCKVFGSDERVDVHGGWYDASGDTSKYLSHLSYANYMNPQQTPQVVWNLIDGRSRLNETDLWMDDRLVDEALHGADFLVRMQNPAGFFYITVFDRWSKDVEERMLCSFTTQEGHRFDTYQAGYRQGGGSTIAALARASSLPRDGDFTRADYLDAAKRGFAHLEEHNTSTSTTASRTSSTTIARCWPPSSSLRRPTKTNTASLRTPAPRACWLDSTTTVGFGPTTRRPAATFMRPRRVCPSSRCSATSRSWLAALPKSPELRSPELEAARIGVRRGLRHEVDITVGAGDNPFHCPRQYVVVPGKAGQVRYFIPHENDSGYWWQGENARLGSLACAAEWGARISRTTRGWRLTCGATPRGRSIGSSA